MQQKGEICPSLTTNIIFNRSLCKVREQTHSLWGYLNNFAVRKNFLNPVYKENQLVIWPSVAPQSLQLWEGEEQSTIANIL